MSCPSSPFPHSTPFPSLSLFPNSTPSPLRLSNFTFLFPILLLLHLLSCSYYCVLQHHYYSSSSSPAFLFLISVMISTSSSGLLFTRPPRHFLLLPRRSTPPHSPSSSLAHYLPPYSLAGAWSRRINSPEWDRTDSRSWFSDFEVRQSFRSLSRPSGKGKGKARESG